MARRLGQLVPDARIAVAHGQMDEGTLERVMVDFWERRFDVLVCTTIVESGIDLPSVNTLIVDRAERLGLGQMHQLRGRVGRSGQRAYAYLFHPADQVLSETAYERLRTIGDNTALGSGFKIAMRDLEIRGAGNLLGHDQSGPVAAVGYDLYVQLVAEAVADAKGFVVPDVVHDHPRRAGRGPPAQGLRRGRRRSSRGLSPTRGRHVVDELEDLRERVDRPLRALPAAGAGTARTGRTATRVPRARRALGRRAARARGVRSKPVVRMSPLDLSLSQQMRVRRTLRFTRVRRGDEGVPRRGDATTRRRRARCSTCCARWSPTPEEAHVVTR